MATSIEELLAEAGLRLPDCYFTPARELTREAARDIVVHLVGASYFKIKEKPFTFKKGSPVPLAPKAQITIAPPVIAGVKFVYVDAIAGSKKTIKYACSAPNLYLQDLRKTVFLFWLAGMLSNTYGATKIYHMGISGGGGRTDYHGQGRAIDFAGAAGPNFDLTVERNWYAQPVCMPMDWKDPKTGKVLARGTKLANWPSGFEMTEYRLDPVTNPYLDWDLTPDLAGPLFEDIYDLAARECMDTRDKAMPPTMLGHLILQRYFS